MTSDVGTLDPINVVEAPRTSLMGSIRFWISHSLKELEKCERWMVQVQSGAFQGESRIDEAQPALLPVSHDATLHIGPRT